MINIRSVFQRVALVLTSVVVGLALAEMGLALDGRYNSLVSRELVTSPAIWEPPANATDFQEHPDLAMPIEVRSDSQGVRNHGDVSTEKKRDIIGFFGDSFTDNRRIDDQFTFTTLLDDIAMPPARVVSYGVDGYGLDQAFLRYKKYEGHDIRHVVYLFCANDLQNLYETGLAELRDGQLRFRHPGPRLHRRILGRVRLTYLAMGIYRRLGGSPRDILTSDHELRFEDAFAESVEGEFLSPNRQLSGQLAEKFVLLLKHWQGEVEARGRTFTVLVLPRETDTTLARALMRPFSGRVIFLRQHFQEEMATFVNDGHWNEYGNLQAASVLAQLEGLPFHGTFGDPTQLAHVRQRIDRYYKEHR